MTAPRSNMNNYKTVAEIDQRLSAIKVRLFEIDTAPPSLIFDAPTQEKDNLESQQKDLLKLRETLSRTEAAEKQNAQKRLAKKITSLENQIKKEKDKEKMIPLKEELSLLNEPAPEKLEAHVRTKIDEAFYEMYYHLKAKMIPMIQGELPQGNNPLGFGWVVTVNNKNVTVDPQRLTKANFPQDNHYLLSQLIKLFELKQCIGDKSMDSFDKLLKKISGADFQNVMRPKHNSIFATESDKFLDKFNKVQKYYETMLESLNNARAAMGGGPGGRK